MLEGMLNFIIEYEGEIALVITVILVICLVIYGCMYWDASSLCSNYCITHGNYWRGQLENGYSTYRRY